MSIYDPKEKINPIKDHKDAQRLSLMGKAKQFIESEHGKDILIIVIVILTGLGSFELGRLSKQDERSGIKIEYTNQDLSLVGNQSASIISTTNSTKVQSNSNKNFFASNRGTKYYSIGCSGGQNLKMENRIYFETKEAAEKAGYTLSSSCQ